MPELSRRAGYTIGGMIAAIVIIIIIVFILHSSSPTLEPIPGIGPFELPKAPHWDGSRQFMFFVDMQNSSIHKYVPSTKTHTSAKVGNGEPIAFIIPINENTNEFIVGRGSELGIVTWDGNTINPAYQSWISLKDVYRVNVGKVSPSGSLFVGSRSSLQGSHTQEPLKPQNEEPALYVINQDKIPRKVLPNVTVAGMAWSKTASTFYFTDSNAKTVSSSTYTNVTDALGPPVVLLNYAEKALQGFPDGLMVDNDDKLWIASNEGSTVLHFDPITHEILNTISVNAYQITSVMFGGSSLKDMYVTTGRNGLSEEILKKYPQSGSIFVWEGSKTIGLPGISFKLTK